MTTDEPVPYHTEFTAEITADGVCWAKVLVSRSG